MKYFFLLAGLVTAACFAQAQNTWTGLNSASLSWNFLLSGSWEESRTLHNRGEINTGFMQPGLFLRGQLLDRRPLNFKLEQPLGESANETAIASFGLYHRPTGSRVLYGILDEWGLPARIRNPWIRSVPYAENRKPVMADLRTSVSTTKTPEMYAYLSSPRMTFFKNDSLPELSMRGFAAAQFSLEDDFVPAFSTGLDANLGKKAGLTLEGFYTSARLAARQSTAWFSDPPSLPERDFRLGAASMLFNLPYFSLSSDWAWSETFAYGSGVYGNMGIRIRLPSMAGEAVKPGNWSISLAADGMTDRYVGRDGTSPAAGFRAAGRLEWKGFRSSTFRANTTLRAPGMAETFNRSSTSLYYRFPALSSRSAEDFPLRLSRISLNADRNASNWKKVQDNMSGTLGLSLGLPPVLLPSALLPASSPKNPRPRSYPLGINLSTSANWLGSTTEMPSPYPFAPANHEFDSAKATCELIWSPGIFQFRTRWGYTAYAKKDDVWDASISAAVRYRRSRLSARITFPTFPEQWNCTVSWRFEK